MHARGFAVVALSAVAVLPGVRLAPMYGVVGAAPAVVVVRLPAGALQPQVASDERGDVQVVYLQGASGQSDIFHTVIGTDGRLRAPVRVNQLQGAAIATGRVRGPHIAIGRDGAVHVAWLGSQSAKAAAAGRTPVLYTRMVPGASTFERERDVLQSTINPDGGAVAATRDGRVQVFWHGSVPGKADEANRRVWMAESLDDGRRFEKERAVSPTATGACGCCGLSALSSRTGDLLLIYRAAREMVHRDAMLLTSHDRGRTFGAESLQEWNVGACPMSTFALSESNDGVVAAWETAGEIAWARVDPKTGTRGAVISPGPSSNRKYPVAVTNARRETLAAWVEDTGWSKGGTLVWQHYDAKGAPMGDRTRTPGLPVWGTAALATRADGSFVVVY